jgi:hypothetical protein
MTWNETGAVETSSACGVWVAHHHQTINPKKRRFPAGFYRFTDALAKPTGTLQVSVRDRQRPG